MTTEARLEEPRWDLEKHFGYAAPTDGKIDEEMKLSLIHISEPTRPY